MLIQDSSESENEDDAQDDIKEMLASYDVNKSENRQKNLSFQELETQLKIIINLLGGLLKFCKQKTDLAIFLASVANEFMTENDLIIEVRNQGYMWNSKIQKCSQRKQIQILQ